MRIRLLSALALAAIVVAGPSIGTAAAPSAQSSPDGCITLNGGDWNACNVGNSGRGDLPYRSVLGASPDECITLNGGDWNACNVGNSEQGDLPYRPAEK